MTSYVNWPAWYRVGVIDTSIFLMRTSNIFISYVTYIMVNQKYFKTSLLPY